MTLGRVYLWSKDERHPLGGTARASMVLLPNLRSTKDGATGLIGRFSQVRNDGTVYVADANGHPVSSTIGNATPDANGDYVFEQGRGGGRIDKVELAEADFRWRYVQASHFGEVNVYFHLDRVAAYVDELLQTMGQASLPCVTAVVNAHSAATCVGADGVRDGVRGTRVWLPFQGGHYRLPGGSGAIAERHPIDPNGEIHFGPGWRLAYHGALVEAAGGRYRANASHNPGIIYHEYGHHLVRHIADLRANEYLPRDRQDNRKTALDEGVADYLAATMLGTPHIWAFHHRHDHEQVHPRSLVSQKTMTDYRRGPAADPHANGTIWGAALWDLRQTLMQTESNGVRHADRLAIGSLLMIGRRRGTGTPTAESVRRARRGYKTGLTALLETDEYLYGGRYRQIICNLFAKRGIVTEGGPQARSLRSGDPSTSFLPN